MSAKKRSTGTGKRQGYVSDAAVVVQDTSGRASTVGFAEPIPAGVRTDRGGLEQP